ncbi:MAG: tetratricopeptide repeat protein [Alphaproteobacteria bacterium]|nr:tetratricopeptide repeat protein [Alphaproteobacteria bacterium]
MLAKSRLLRWALGGGAALAALSVLVLWLAPGLVGRGSGVPAPPSVPQRIDLMATPAPPAAAPASPAPPAAAPASPAAAAPVTAAPAPPAGASPPSPPAPPASPAEARRRYEACLERAHERPEAALVEAEAWAGGGGGGVELARHCGAVALINLGRFSQAADRLEALALDARAPTQLRAMMYSQASQAWMMDSNAHRAYGAITMALMLMPDHPELLLDRAIAAVSGGNYFEALDDLNKVIDLSPRSVEAFVVRAATWRFLENLDLAEDDIARALGLDPRNPEALLERGVLHRMRGNDGAARRDWQQVIAIAPDVVAAEMAQQNLDMLAAGRLPPPLAPSARVSPGRPQPVAPAPPVAAPSAAPFAAAGQSTPPAAPAPAGQSAAAAAGPQSAVGAALPLPPLPPDRRAPSAPVPASIPAAQGPVPQAPQAAAGAPELVAAQGGAASAAAEAPLPLPPVRPRGLRPWRAR